jgi:hypothetical protein
MSYAQIGCREGIDSRLLTSGTANFTPGPSFAHNLGCRCPNFQCEGILDIYVSRPFQRHQEHPNARCFAPCCRALNIRESRRTPNPQLFQVLGFTPTLGQSGVAIVELTLHLFEFCGSTHHFFYVSVRPNNTYLPNFWSQLTQKSPPLFGIENFPPLEQFIQSFKILLNPFLGFLFDDIEPHSNIISVHVAILLHNH